MITLGIICIIYTIICTCIRELKYKDVNDFSKPFYLTAPYFISNIVSGCYILYFILAYLP